MNIEKIPAIRKYDIKYFFLDYIHRYYTLIDFLQFCSCIIALKETFMLKFDVNEKFKIYETGEVFSLSDDLRDYL